MYDEENFIIIVRCNGLICREFFIIFMDGVYDK